MVETKLESLEYLIRHRAIFTELKLNKIGMEENAKCTVCQEEDKVFLHLFLYCKELQEFHEKCKCLINDLRRDESEQEMEWNRVVMLGMGSVKIKKVINLFLMLIKSAIWERRIMAKKEKKN